MTLRDLGEREAEKKKTFDVVGMFYLAVEKKNLCTLNASNFVFVSKNTGDILHMETTTLYS